MGIVTAPMSTAETPTRAPKGSHFVTVPMIRRMRELRALGISAAAIGRIVGHDWHLAAAISGETVRRYAPTDIEFGPGRTDVVGLSHNLGHHLP